MKASHRHGIARIGILVGALLAALLVATVAAADPLPSWNDGANKQAIVRFVEQVTQYGSPTFVPIPERIATFDNDGTLWTEQPLYFQFAFALDRVRALAPQHPEWKTQQPFQAVLENDTKALIAAGQKGMLEILATTHTGTSVEEFSRVVDAWITSARHPRSQRRYTDMVYQPMLELLAYLRANGFKTYVVSGGGVEFMRAWSERVYGIPPEQVIGSSVQTVLSLDEQGRLMLLREPHVEFVDDGPGKVVGIQRYIGRRPIFAVGNSDGDLQMLQWTAGGEGPRFAAIVWHTDAEREWAYDRESRIGRLDKALDEGRKHGWTFVDMKQDWKRIYPHDR